MSVLRWPEIQEMDEERLEGERRSGYDRRSPFSDPKLWVSICAILLTIFLALFSYIASQLSQISATVQAYQLTTTKNETEIAQLRRDLEQQRSANQLLESRIIVVEKQNERTAAILQLAKAQ